MGLRSGWAEASGLRGSSAVADVANILPCASLFNGWPCLELPGAWHVRLTERSEGRPFAAPPGCLPIAS